jgi:hypothetical protein
MPQYVQGLVPGETRRTKILLPESASYRKIVAYKIRLRRGEPGLGGKLRCPYNLDIDEGQIDNMSIRKHIHLRLTGLLEQKYGTFVWQESDQMQSTTYIEEWGEREDSERRWSTFVRHEPKAG